MKEKIKNILVTGGGQNFGLQLVKNFLLYPNLNIIILTRNPNKLKKELKGYKNIFQYKPTDFNSNKILINKIQKKFGGIDVLINNATLNAQKNFSKFIENSDDKKVKNYYLINSVSPLLMIKYILLGSTKRKMIINMLAGRALTGHSRHVEYYSSKAALYNATITLSNDYKNHNFVNIMMGKIDLSNHDELKKIFKYFNKIINNFDSENTKRKSNYKEVYLFFSIFKYLKSRVMFFLKNMMNSKKI